MTTPCSLSLLLRQNPAVQWCGCSRGSWVQTPLPTLKWEQAAPCCPADVDAEGTSHGLRIPQPTQVAMAPEGDVGLGWSPQQLRGLVPARQAHIRAPTPSENAASAARVSAGEPVDMATPCGGSAAPASPRHPLGAWSPLEPPPEWLWDTAGSQHGWWQGWVRCSKMPHAVKKQPLRFHALQGFAFPFRYQTSASPWVPC